MSLNYNLLTIANWSNIHKQLTPLLPLSHCRTNQTCFDKFPQSPMSLGSPHVDRSTKSEIVFIKYRISYSLDKLPKMCKIPWQNCTGVSQTTLDASIVVPFEFHSENMWVFHLRTSPCTWRQAALTYSQKFAAWILIHAYPNQIQLDTHRKGQPWLVLCLKWTLACRTKMSQNWMMKDKILSKGRSEAAKTKATNRVLRWPVVATNWCLSRQPADRSELEKI